MTIQRYEEVPAVCENKKCPAYKAFELVDMEDILEDDAGAYIYCPDCQERIEIKD